MTKNIMDVYNTFYYVIFAIEGFFFWRYCAAVFKSKDKRYEIAVTEAFYIMLSIIIGIVPFEQSMIYFAGVNLLCIYMLYDVKLCTALLHTVLTSAAMLLGEVVSIFATMQFVAERMQEVQMYHFIVNDISARILYLLFLYIMMLVWQNKSDRGWEIDKASVLMLAVPVISILVIPVMVFVLVYAKPELTIELIITLCMAFLTILNLIVLGVCNYILRKNNEYAALQMQVQKEQDLTSYYRMFLEQNENQRILIHDIKKHLQSVQLLYEQGESAKASDYIGRLALSSAFDESVRVSDNTLLNAIVYRYRKVCIENGIAFHTDIRKGTVDFLSEQDLTALFGNLLDNAVEAVLAQKGSQQTESFIELNVEYRENGGFTMVTMVNSCAARPVLSETGWLLSAKGDRQHHGLGMKSIARVVKVCHGKMKTYYDDGKGTFHTVILLKEMSEN